jgi:putative transposase
MGVLKGKLAIKPFNSYPEMKQKPYGGNHFWVQGSYIGTFGIE